MNDRPIKPEDILCTHRWSSGDACGEPMLFSGMRAEFVCSHELDGHNHAPMSEHYAALHRLGPYATPQPYKPAPLHLDGFVQIGPNTYERITDRDADFKQVWHDGLRSVASIRRKGEW